MVCRLIFSQLTLYFVGKSLPRLLSGQEMIVVGDSGVVNHQQRESNCMSLLLPCISLMSRFSLSQHLYQFNNLYFQGSTFFTIDVSGDVYFNPSVLSGFIQGISQAPRQQVPINFQQQFPFQQPPVGSGEGYGSNYGGQQYQNYAFPPPGAYPNQQSVSVTPPRGYYGAPPSDAYPFQGGNSGALPGAYQQTSYGGDPNSGTHPPGAYSKQDASGDPNYGAPQSKSDAPHSVAPSPSHQLNYAAPAPFNYAFNGPPPNYGAPPSNIAYAEEDAPVVVAVRIG
jgi:hypothetical protein